MIEALKSDDLGMRQEAAVYFLAHEPGMAGRAIDALVERIANPTEGSHYGWALVIQAQNAHPGARSNLSRRNCSSCWAARPSLRHVHLSIAALGEIGREAIAARSRAAGTLE